MTTFGKNRKIKTLRRCGGAGVVFLFFLITAGCGIPNYAYLDPPKMGDRFDKDKYATFLNSTENNPDIFQGYQIYAKFYSDGEKVDSGNLSTQRDLENNGFIKLATPLIPEDSWRFSPLIKLTEAEKEASLSFTFSFEDDNPGTSSGFNTKISYNGKEVSVARFLNVSVPLKSFSEADLEPEDRSNDPIDGGDLPADFPLPETIGEYYLYLSIYLVSYGIDSDLSPIYSIPLYLGVVELSVDETLSW